MAHDDYTRRRPRRAPVQGRLRAEHRGQDRGRSAERRISAHLSPLRRAARNAPQRREPGAAPDRRRRDAAGPPPDDRRVQLVALGAAFASVLRLAFFRRSRYSTTNASMRLTAAISAETDSTSPLSAAVSMAKALA